MGPASRCRVETECLVRLPMNPGVMLKIASWLGGVVDVAGVEVGVEVGQDDGVALLQDRGCNLQ